MKDKIVEIERLADIQTSEHGNIDSDATSHLMAIVEAAKDSKTNGRGSVTVSLKVKRSRAGDELEFDHEVKVDMPKLRRATRGKVSELIDIRQGQLALVPPRLEPEPTEATHVLAEVRERFAEIAGEGGSVTLSTGSRSVTIPGRRARGAE